VAAVAELEHHSHMKLAVVVPGVLLKIWHFH
jgi:hypothetical protein